MIENKLNAYCVSRLFKFEIEGDILELCDREYQIVQEDEKLFGDDFEFLPTQLYEDVGFVYYLCGRWYTQEPSVDNKVQKVSFNELLYKGEPNVSIPTNTFLGVHTGHELLNGMGTIEKWVEKAKFLRVESLGICELNNLSGVLAFQSQCINNGIKPITGMSVSILHPSDSEYEVKAYAKNFQGWQSLLKFNKTLNVDDRKVTEKELEDEKDNLHIIIDTKKTKFNLMPNFVKYYQLEMPRFLEEFSDRDFLDNMGSYLGSDLEPVLLSDAYYLEQESYITREKLWTIAKTFDCKTDNQFFKSHLQSAMELIEIFEKGNTSWKGLFKTAVTNVDMIAKECDFVYDTSSRHLPEYIMTKEESIKFASKIDLFNHRIEEGISRKISKEDEPKYRERGKMEIDILVEGDVIDYFLNTVAITEYTANQGTLLGVARGSAGGCMVAYILDITKIDPFDYDLIFERFLNKGRMGEWTECEAYEIETDEGTIKLNEKSLLKIVRNQKTINIFVEQLQDGDEIINY